MFKLQYESYFQIKKGGIVQLTLELFKIAVYLRIV